MVNMNSSDDAFFSYYAGESASETTLARFLATRDAVLCVARSFGVRGSPLEVADIGCGAATQCAIWARDGHHVHGVDINERLVELGRKRAAEQRLEMALSVSSATSLPWQSGSMDICLCPELLEHVADWQACLSEAVRVLRPGGVLYLSTTNRLCPVQEEFTLPLYSWYPALLKRHCERLAVTSKPAIANHARYPAVNWFTFFQLRRYLSPYGFESIDRFDLAALRTTAPLARAILGFIRSVAPLRYAAHVLTPYTVLIGHKRPTAQPVSLNPSSAPSP